MRPAASFPYSVSRGDVFEGPHVAELALAVLPNAAVGRERRGKKVAVLRANYLWGRDMLPDYPKVKARLVEEFNTRYRQVRNLHLGFFASAQMNLLQEGSRHVLIREDGSSDTATPKQIEASATLEFDWREAEKLTIPKILTLIDTLAQRMAEQQVKQYIEKIDESVKKIGNVTDPDKKGVEAFFDGVQKRLMEFDEAGQPIPPQLLVGDQQTHDKLVEIMTQIAESPDLRNRYEAIVNKKREEWRDREAARNLVD